MRMRCAPCDEGVLDAGGACVENVAENDERFRASARDHQRQPFQNRCVRAIGQREARFAEDRRFSQMQIGDEQRARVRIENSAIGEQAKFISVDLDFHASAGGGFEFFQHPRERGGGVPGIDGMRDAIGPQRERERGESFAFFQNDDALLHGFHRFAQAREVHLSFEHLPLRLLEQKIFGIIPSRWVAEHTKYEPPKMFEDVQISGPFHKWRHQHIVLPHETGAILRDEINYEPPFWIFGAIAAPFAVVPKLEKMFAYRHEVTRKWCESEI